MESILTNKIKDKIISNSGKLFYLRKERCIIEKELSDYSIDYTKDTDWIIHTFDIMILKACQKQLNELLND